MPTAKPTAKKRVRRTTAKRRKSPKRSKTTYIKVPVRLALAGLTGLLLLLVGSWWMLYSQTVLSFKAAPIVVANAELRGSVPTKVSIVQTGMQVDVLPTTIIDGIWQIPDGSAAYLESSARPKEDGNIIVYGHNKKDIFGPLHEVELGDTVDISAADGTKYSYTVAEIRVVKPDAVGEVLPTDQEVLTIYTCTGLFDSQRLVIKAYPSQLASL